MSRGVFGGVFSGSLVFLFSFLRLVGLFVGCFFFFVRGMDFMGMKRDGE